MSEADETPVSTRVESCPVLQTNVRWPGPVDQLLNELVRRFVEASAGDITRSRLLAAIVCNAPRGGPELAELVHQYRVLTAGDVLDQTGGSFALPGRTPGRRAQGT